MRFRFRPEVSLGGSASVAVMIMRTGTRGAAPHRRQDKCRPEKIVLGATRKGTILGGDAHVRISWLAGVVRVGDLPAPRSRSGRSGPQQQSHPAGARQRYRRRRQPASALPGARPRRHEPAGGGRLGASGGHSGADGAVAERALPPVGGFPGGDRAPASGSADEQQAAALAWAASAHRGWQQPESARQQGNRLAAARGIRSGAAASAIWR